MSLLKSYVVDKQWEGRDNLNDPQSIMVSFKKEYNNFALEKKCQAGIRTQRFISPGLMTEQ